MEITENPPVRRKFLVEVDEDELFTLFAGIAQLSGQEFSEIKKKYKNSNTTDTHRASLYEQMGRYFPRKPGVGRW